MSVRLPHGLHHDCMSPRQIRKLVTHPLQCLTHEDKMVFMSGCDIPQAVHQTEIGVAQFCRMLIPAPYILGQVVAAHSEAD